MRHRSPNEPQTATQRVISPQLLPGLPRPLRAPEPWCHPTSQQLAVRSCSSAAPLLVIYRSHVRLPGPAASTFAPPLDRRIRLPSASRARQPLRRQDLVHRPGARRSGRRLAAARPRRFGKTTNLSTLRYYLEKSEEDHSPLFAGLAIWQETRLREHFGRYPVIWLTFKDVKESTWEGCFALTCEVLSELYGQHKYLLDREELSEDEATVFRAILAKRASPSECSRRSRT